ncbi:MAG: DNA primase, partial [Acidimicrobiia bacterium]
MGILEEDVVRVREASDLVAIASERIALKRVGRRHQGLCPFHAERTPSFSVNGELGVYFCFGCGARGDVITFIRELEHLAFADAVERLAARAGISLRYDDAAVKKVRQRRDRLVEVVAESAARYHELLLHSPEGGLARRYLRSRGFDGDVARRFHLGWAPESSDLISRELQNRGFSRDDLLEAGVSFVNRSNRLQDHFRSRLMFPVYDVRGEPAGFGGRTLGAAGPKYRNSPETALYQKSRLLYGLNWSKDEIVAKSEAIVCEGYTDVMGAFVAGLPRAVATCGTALADGHVELLKNFARTLVLAFDADSAGAAATERFYAWEDRYELLLKVVKLSPGEDPADLAQGNPERLRSAVAEARPFLRFRLERLLEQGDRQSAEGRATLAERAIALIAQHPSDLVRDQYLMELSGTLSIAPERLREATRERRSTDGAARRGAAGTPDRPRQESEAQGDRGAPRALLAKVDRREIEGLRLAVHRPETVAARLVPELFSHRVTSSAFAALVASATFHESLERSD